MDLLSDTNLCMDQTGNMLAVNWQVPHNIVSRVAMVEKTPNASCGIFSLK